ncbi:MAG: hypothetical protein WKF44_09940, partial [Rubrobacteraceae bacterium]
AAFLAIAARADQDVRIVIADLRPTRTRNFAVGFSTSLAGFPGDLLAGDKSLAFSLARCGRGDCGLLIAVPDKPNITRVYRWCGRPVIMGGTSVYNIAGGGI